MTAVRCKSLAWVWRQTLPCPPSTLQQLLRLRLMTFKSHALPRFDVAFLLQKLAAHCYTQLWELTFFPPSSPLMSQLRPILLALNTSNPPLPSVKYNFLVFTILFFSRTGQIASRCFYWGEVGVRSCVLLCGGLPDNDFNSQPVPGQDSAASVHSCMFNTSGANSRTVCRFCCASLVISRLASLSAGRALSNSSELQC